jgi:hypothetical protein
MKYLFIFLFPILKISSAYAQDSITGLWYSEDSSRIYKIQNVQGKFEATLVDPKRTEDIPGVLILGGLVYNKHKKTYSGFIRAVSDGTTVHVKIFRENDGRTLRLKLRRLFIFPVYLHWIKKE